MPVILAVEPDRRQAAQIAAIVRHQVGAELVLADTTERALDALGSRVPDMVLVPALLSPQDDAALAAALRVIAAATHVRTLTIPVLANTRQQSSGGGLLSRWRRNRDEPSSTVGCDPSVFAEQITAYLAEAAAERAELEEMPARATVIADAAPVASFEQETSEPEGYAAAPLVDEGDVDLSTALVATPAEKSEEQLFAGEPFATYTLPSLDEIQPESAIRQDNVTAFEASANVESSFAAEQPAALDAPVPFEAPVAFEPPVAFDESPVAFDEAPVAFDESRVIFDDAPVLFDDASIFDESPLSLEAPLASDTHVVLEAFDDIEPLEASMSADESLTAEPPSTIAAPAAPPAPAWAQPTAFEASVAAAPAAQVVRAATIGQPPVLDLSAPTPMTPWHLWPTLEGVPIEVPGIAAAKQEVAPDWSELMASLRQDMERRRSHDQPQVAKPRKRPTNAKPLVDEWGFFDPEQCGFSALLAKLDEITSPESRS